MSRGADERHGMTLVLRGVARASDVPPDSPYAAVVDELDREAAA
jgi:hypothetical protein